MQKTLDASILHKGNLVKKHLARARTVLTYLAGRQDLSAYMVYYWVAGRPHRVTATAFCELFASHGKEEHDGDAS